MEYVRLSAAGITVLWLLPSAIIVLTLEDGQAGIVIVGVGVLACALYCAAIGLLRGLSQSRHTWWNGWSFAIGLLVVCLCIRGYSVIRGCHLLQVATNPRTDSQSLTALYEERTAWFGEDLLPRLAANPNSPEPLLRKLFVRGGDVVYYALATNPSTPPDVLEELGHHEDQLVESALRRNPAVKQ
jgi:hypothetical protein